jgi:hypothetical protein
VNEVWLKILQNDRLDSDEVVASMTAYHSPGNEPGDQGDVELAAVIRVLCGNNRHSEAKDLFDVYLSTIRRVEGPLARILQESLDESWWADRPHLCPAVVRRRGA